MANTAFKRPATARRAWWVLPLSVWLLSVLLVGALALGRLAWPASMPTFSLGFSDFTHMKVWLATAVLVLAGGQLLWAAHIYGLLRFAPRGRFSHVVHRWAGRLALLLTLPIAYHCVILVGRHPLDTRVWIHAGLGAFVYGAFATKVLFVRLPGLPGWWLPVAGGILFCMLLGLWLTSVPWFVSIYGLSL